MSYRGSVNRVVRSRVMSRLPLLPVNPVRYLRLALNATRNASSLRSASWLEMTLRRVSNSVEAGTAAAGLAPTGQTSRQHQGFIGQFGCRAHFAALLRVFRLPQEALDVRQQPRIRASLHLPQ